MPCKGGFSGCGGNLFLFEQMGEVDSYWDGGASGCSVTVTARDCLFSAFRNISQVFCAEQGSIAEEPKQVFLFIASIPLHS